MAKQYAKESFYEFWGRFQELLARCPYHHILSEHLVQYFHLGLRFACRKNLDAAAGGSIDDLTPSEAWNLIEKIVNNDHLYGGYNARKVYEVSARSSQDYNSLSSQFTAMNTYQQFSFLIEQYTCSKPYSQALVALSYQLYYSPIHTSVNCPTHCEDVSAIYQGR